jgi:gas vesicle protein
MIVGAATGAALALLYTPRSGRRAMEVLRARGIDLGSFNPSAVEERVSRAAGEARQAASDTRSELRDRFQNAKREGHTDS